METMAYVRRMRDLREDSDYTQAYVASVLGTSQTMSTYDAKPPRTLHSVSAALGTKSVRVRT